MAVRNLPSILVHRLNDFSQSTAFNGLTIVANVLATASRTSPPHTFTLSILQQIFFHPDYNI
jgi:hypothetical protein